jgi:hypothetical protein
MSTSNWSHLDDLSLDKLYPVIFGEDPRLTHPMIFLDRKAMLEKPNGHPESLLSNMILRFIRDFYNDRWLAAHPLSRVRYADHGES